MLPTRCATAFPCRAGPTRRPSTPGSPASCFTRPLSWLLGALLLLTLPSAVVPAAFTFLALSLAGGGMYALGRRFTTPAGALLASALYLANPYLLFTAFERSAFAELLAAAWMPWLLRAALAGQPQPLAVAVPLALLWLTNAPAAVMGTYAFGLIVCSRAGLLLWRGAAPRSLLPLLIRSAGGLALGLALPGFYLVPAAWERRYVQIAMAIIPNMRVEDNFLFGHTGYGPHDQVLHTASLVAVALVGLTTLALLFAFARSHHDSQPPQTSPDADIRRDRLGVLALSAVCIASLLFRVTLPLWHHLPELAFLQFPWRWMAVLGCVFGAGIALAVGRSRLPLAATALGAVALLSAAGPLAMVPFREGCEAHELPAERVALFAAHHGVGPTDEYTPGDADNDQLRWDDPAWWLTDNPNAPGPNTVPNPAATIVDYDQPPPLEQTVSGRAPTHLLLDLEKPQDLVLNLRDYPAWAVTANGTAAPRLERDDGLIAIALPAGHTDVAVHWRTLPDVWLGVALSAGALGIAAWIAARSRKIGV